MTRREKLLLDILRGIDWLCTPYHHMQRSIDVAILWPQCCEHARADGISISRDGIVYPIDHARSAFACHAMDDPAWRVLGADEICRRIDALDWRLP